MNDDKDYYEVLGLKPNASGGKIEAAYQDLIKAIRKELKKCDPSHCPDDEQVKAHYFDLQKSELEVEEAYSLLQDPAVRRDYKELGYIPLEKHGYFKNRDGMVIHIAKAQFNAKFSYTANFFCHSFKETDADCGIKAPDALEAEGPDCFAAIGLTESELQLGAEKQVSYNRNVLCPACDGKGHEGEQAPAVCMECNGKGYITTQVRKFIIKMKHIQPCEKCKGRGEVYQNPCLQCNGLCKIRTGCSTMVAVLPGSIYGEIMKIEGLGNEVTRGDFGDLYVQFVMPSRASK